MPGRHAPPFRMLDRVLAREPARSVVLKTITADEILQPRRRDDPQGPASLLIVEALAQAAIPLAGPQGASGARLVALDRVRLRGRLRPGDRLRVEARVVARLGPLLRVRGRALRLETPGTGRRPGRRSTVAEGEVTLALDGPESADAASRR